MGDMQGEAIAAPGRAAPGAGRGAIAALRSRTGLSVALLLVLAAFWLLGAARGASLADLLSLTVWGVMLGGIIALGAIGLTLVYGVLKFPNFAHGELVTVGAYAAFTFMGFLPQGAALRPFSFGPELIVALQEQLSAQPGVEVIDCRSVTLDALPGFRMHFTTQGPVESEEDPAVAEGTTEMVLYGAVEGVTLYAFSLESRRPETFERDLVDFERLVASFDRLESVAPGP